MTLRQPTFGHDGNAGNDEEFISMVSNRVNNSRQPIVFDVLANATDEQLDELTIVVVAELDRQAAEQRQEDAEAARGGAE